MAGTSLIPEWEDIIAAAPMQDEWRGFVDTLCITDGSGGTKVRSKDSVSSTNLS